MPVKLKDLLKLGGRVPRLVISVLFIPVSLLVTFFVALRIASDAEGSFEFGILWSGILVMIIVGVRFASRARDLDPNEPALRGDLLEVMRVSEAQVLVGLMLVMMAWAMTSHASRSDQDSQETVRVIMEKNLQTLEQLRQEREAIEQMRQNGFVSSKPEQ